MLESSWQARELFRHIMKTAVVAARRFASPGRCNGHLHPVIRGARTHSPLPAKRRWDGDVERGRLGLSMRILERATVAIYVFD